MSDVVGSIYFHKEFEFQDGTIGEKLFVIVNSPSAQENYLVCKTTSREKPPYRLRRQGCDEKRNYFMFSSKDDWFKKNTWIQFDKIFEFTAERLLQDRFGHKTKYMDCLKPNNIRAVLNCILKSEDVMQKHLASIRKTLKSL